MEPIRIIRDIEALQSTCYIELLAGEYQEQCWNDGSLFIDQEVFTLFEAIIVSVRRTP